MLNNSYFAKNTMSPAKVFETDEERLLRCQHAIIIRAVRNALGLSARELAQLVGVHTTSILKAETNQTRIKPHTLEKIKEILRERGGHFMIGLSGNLHIEIDSRAVKHLMLAQRDADEQDQVGNPPDAFTP